MPPIFFKTPSDLRKWFEKNHDKATELIVGYYNKDSGKQSITWPESVDQALCFGWIDGIRRSIDDSSYQIRFTPRKASSTWSGINLNKVKELKKAGLMHPAGLAIHEKRKPEKERRASYEQTHPAGLSPAYEKKFKGNKKAWTYWESRPPGYKKKVLHWVMSAKQEATQVRRLEQLIEDCAKQQKIKQMDIARKQ